MSRTRRKDSLDVQGSRPDYVHAIYVGLAKPSAKEVREAHMDGKKSRKPGRKAKVYLHKGRKAKPKEALRKMVDPDELVMPVEKRTDIWRYN